jgi:hypothetical protein
MRFDLRERFFCPGSVVRIRGYFQIRAQLRRFSVRVASSGVDLSEEQMQLRQVVPDV